MSEQEVIPISLVCHWVFCPRRAWLEAAGEVSDSYQMEVGFSSHEHVDDTSTERQDEVRALEVKCEELGIVGKLDSVKHLGSGYEIVEYKATPVKQVPTVTNAMRIQLALQTMCMQSSGFEVANTAIFFTSHHKQINVQLTSEDFEAAKNAVCETFSVISNALAPAPLEDNPKCANCSHLNICLPDERELKPVERKIRVSNPSEQVVHLTTPGSYARSRAGRMEITKNGEALNKVALDTISAVQVHGNVNLSGGLIRELLWRNITITWCTGTGHLVGWAVSGCGPNGKARTAQHVASAEGRLALAREFIAAKIANQATQLRRSGNVDANIIETLRTLQKSVGGAVLWQDVLGIEGKAASIYFENWQCLIKPAKRKYWQWPGVRSRPATDPINAMLNYVYTLLLSDAVKAITSCGLDPHAGFLHSSNRNKPALALDLMEEFRAPIADSVVQTVINNGEVQPSGFQMVMNSVRMSTQTRKALVCAYERRMETEIKHPIFGYRASWRRTVEIQARQVLGFLDGSQQKYQGVRVR